jgi:hypothetical protein
LSPSPSPPPFWGIPEADAAGVDVVSGAALEDEDVAGLAVVAELEELDEPE